ncbi:hypothetical protein ACQKWADRAFT_328429 [Trichoderma austrokoningii]
MVLFKPLLFLLSTAACAAAESQPQGGFVVERGLADGIYQAIAVQGPSLESPSAPPSGHKSLRRYLKTPPGQGDFYEKPGEHREDLYSVPIPASRHSCHKDHQILLNSTEYRRAVDNLWDYCQNFNVPFHGTHFSIVGDVVAYVCDYHGERPCHRHEWLEAEHIMDKKCGQGKGSHVQMGKWLKEYGRAYVGKRICSSFNFGVDIAWKAQPLPVWANGQPLGHWKSGRLRFKGVNGKNKNDGTVIADGKKEKTIDDERRDNTG